MKWRNNQINSQNVKWTTSVMTNKNGLYCLVGNYWRQKKPMIRDFSAAPKLIRCRISRDNAILLGFIASEDGTSFGASAIWLAQFTYYLNVMM